MSAELHCAACGSPLLCFVYSCSPNIADKFIEDGHLLWKCQNSDHTKGRHKITLNNFHLCFASFNSKVLYDWDGPPEVIAAAMIQSEQFYLTSDWCKYGNKMHYVSFGCVRKSLMKPAEFTVLDAGRVFFLTPNRFDSDRSSSGVRYYESRLRFDEDEESEDGTYEREAEAALSSDPKVLFVEDSGKQHGYKSLVEYCKQQSFGPAIQDIDEQERMELEMRQEASKMPDYDPRNPRIFDNWSCRPDRPSVDV